MTRRRLATHINYSLFSVLVLTGLWLSPARAQSAVTATVTSQHHANRHAHQLKRAAWSR